MRPLDVRPGLSIPAEHFAVSYTRDLGRDGGPEAARLTPTTVELRLCLGGCGALSDDERRRILASVDLPADRRGTIRVVYGAGRSRAANLDGARELLARLIREALDPADEAHDVEPTDQPSAPRRARRGLIKPTKTPGAARPARGLDPPDGEVI